MWEYAAAHDLTIVSKDSDFRQRSFLFGFPPKVIWLQRGNCATDEVAEILRQHRAELARFEQDREAAFLVLS